MRCRRHRGEELFFYDLERGTKTAAASFIVVAEELGITNESTKEHIASLARHYYKEYHAAGKVAQWKTCTGFTEVCHALLSQARCVRTGGTTALALFGHIQGSKIWQRKFGKPDVDTAPLITEWRFARAAGRAETARATELCALYIRCTGAGNEHVRAALTGDGK